MTPQEFLNDHPLTRQLKAEGLTDDQLAEIRFRNNEGFDFDQWACTWGRDVPLTVIPFIKSYCTLKWLLLEEPKASRDKEDAQRCVAEFMASPVFEAGLRFLRGQQERAKKRRGKVTENGESIDEIVAHFCGRPEHRESSSKELWRSFFGELDKRYLEPTELDALNYGFVTDDGQRRKISFSYFSNLVSKARKSLSH